MKHLSLASRYRPQTFAEVIGQRLATTALSRAAAENRVAPAYLLSGTRGVGKTTIARIFAKALNCAHAPVAEPCNQCRQCLQITAGNHVDVSEIDGASNTGVDDVRSLRENIGFMPMEGRYKIFIVDEAHMLSKNAFNALLKTLEEPPGHTVFIFATTEAHRFPATIISRCQHFVFRHLPEDTIYQHLCAILQKEKVDYDEGAVRLLARRAAGSARDSLSLLDQVLSLCQGKLDEQTARDSLGLAGQDFFNELFMALASQDCGKIIDLSRHLLHSGVDIGFFIRELSGNLRNLFLLGQMGENILPALSISGDEAAFLNPHVKNFSSAHLHAAWQMTLENQRSIAQNPEPGSALELLLINLALLPRLLPVGSAPVNPGSETPREKNWTLQEERPVPFPGRGEIDDTTNSGGAQPNWEGFCEFCGMEANKEKIQFPRDILKGLDVKWENGIIDITASQIALTRLEKSRPAFTEAIRRYCGGEVPVINIGAAKAVRSHKEMMAACAGKAEVKLCEDILQATLADCEEKRPIDNMRRGNAKYE